MTTKELKKKYLNKQIHIISFHNHIDVWGVVKSIEGTSFRGTWGDYVADYNRDYISLID